MLLMNQVQQRNSFYQFFPPLAIHAFNESGSNTLFLKKNPPPWQSVLLVNQVQVQYSFYQFFPPPMAMHSFND